MLEEKTMVKEEEDLQEGEIEATYLVALILSVDHKGMDLSNV